MWRRYLILLTATVLLAVPAGAAAAVPTWVDPVGPISDAASDSFNPDVAIDGSGTAIAVWQAFDGSNYRIVASVRPPGGSFGAPVPLSAAGADSGFSHVATDAAGNALVVWSRSSSSALVEASFRPVGGAFGAPVRVSDVGEAGYYPQVAMDPAGDALVAYQGGAGGTATMRAAFRPAGGSFAPAVTLSAAGNLANQFDVAFGPAGDAIVAWPRKTGTDSNVADARVEAAFRPAGGAFQAAVPVSGLAKLMSSVHAAFEPSSAVQVTYAASNGSRNRIEVARAPFGGPFATPQDVTATGGTSTPTFFPDLAIDRDGNALLAWMEGFQMWTAVRPAGAASYGAAVRISPVYGDVYSPDVRFDPSGNAVIMWPEEWINDTGTTSLGIWMTAMVRPAGASTFTDHRKISPQLGGNGLYSGHAFAVGPTGDGVAVWSDPTPSPDTVGAVGLDGAPPVLGPVTVPASGTLGTTLSFSATAVDVWSSVVLGWTFGDGGGAGTADATHAYGAPGTYSAVVTATDGLGNATSSAPRSVTITSAPAATPGGGGGPGTGAGTPDTTAPRLTAASLTPATFRAATSGAAVSARTRIGGKLRFRLDEPATVTLTVARATVGRKVGATCRRTTAANRRRARCTRYVAVSGHATATAPAGAVALTFRGRIGSRRLAPARYRLTLVAADAAANRSGPTRLPFRIVRG